MPTSVIDGAVEEADLRIDRAVVKIFRRVRFRLDDGSDHTVEKVVTTKGKHEAQAQFDGDAGYRYGA